MAVRIEILEGPMQGKVVELTRPGSYTVGRSADCDCPLREDDFVSRQHFELIVYPDRCGLRDLGSRNGVVVNDVRYFASPELTHAEREKKPSQKLRLNSGDRIQVGHSLLRVTLLSADGEPTPGPEEVAMNTVAISDPMRVPDIPGYVIHGHLGKGFFSQTYLATEVDGGCRVALRLTPQSGDGALDQRLLRLFRDAEISARLRHENIASWKKAGSLGRLGLRQLPFWPFGTLGDLFSEEKGKLDMDRAVGLVTQSLDGLVFLHGRGIVHRDLRPANLLLEPREAGYVVRITGLGLARVLGGGEEWAVIDEDVPPSALAFRAKELIRSFNDAEAPADVFAMGATLYFLLTGRSPYALRRTEDPVKEILAAPIVPVQRRNSGVPSDLAEVVDRAVQEVPANRFETARAFREALRGFEDKRDRYPGDPLDVADLPA